MTTVEMLPLTEFAERIGISYNVVYGWIRHHGLPHIQIGHRRYIEPSAYDEWLQSKMTKNTTQTKKERLKAVLEEIEDVPLPRISSRIAAKCVKVY